MPTTNPGTFQARNSISFSQVASEFNQVNDGTREIKFSDYAYNGSILNSNTVGTISYEDFDGSTTTTIPNDLVHSEYTSVSDQTGDISSTGMSSVTWTTIGNITGLKVARLYLAGSGTSDTNLLNIGGTSVSNDTGYLVRFTGTNAKTNLIPPDFLNSSLSSNNVDGEYPLSTPYGNRPNNWQGASSSPPNWVLSPVGTNEWALTYSPNGNWSQVQFCDYRYANGTNSGGCGTTESAVSGLSSSQLYVYTITWVIGTLGQYAKKVYNYVYPAQSNNMQLSRCYQLKNSRKTIDGVATATATGVIV